MIDRDTFSVNKDIAGPIYAEPFWGGYYGKEPYVKVYQVDEMDRND